MRTVGYDTIRSVALDALSTGAVKTGAITVEWDISGDCQAPVGRELFARDPDKRPINPRWLRGSRGTAMRPVADKVPGTRAPLRMLLTVRCRKCDNCRKQRAGQWAQRARNEIGAAHRTWFGTLTLRPEAHTYALAKARKAAADSGVDFDAESYKEQFIRRHRVIGPWITKYLKRLRKETEANFKYLLVAEAHKSGLPHYHILIHELSPDDILRYDTLRGQWPFGFSEFKLVRDKNAANYISKYLSKSAAARVRASKRYGDVLGPSDVGA